MHHKNVGSVGSSLRIPEDCTTCTIALQGDVARVTIYNSIEEFIVAFETPGYYGDKWHRERYRQLEW